MTTTDPADKPGRMLPGQMQEIIEDFAALSDSDRVQLLLEFSKELPDLPEHLQIDAMEPVPECQSPLFLSVDATDAEHVQLYFSAPPEAPTTRGFAAILEQGLNTLPAAEILTVPDDFYHSLGLDSVVSPLRLRGMAAMLSRIKSQVSAQQNSN